MAELTWRVLSDEEIRTLDEQDAEYRAAEDERAREVRACPSHEWEMEIPHPEDEAHVTLRCALCPADTHDLYPDSHDMLYAEFDNGVTVTEGRADAAEPMVIPVEVDISTWRHWTDYGYEYDVEIQIEQRGPARIEAGSVE
jgi:hypothetical protein